MASGDTERPFLNRNPMALGDVVKGDKITLKNFCGTVTLFFPIFCGVFSIIGPQIIIIALSVMAQSRIFSYRSFHLRLFSSAISGMVDDLFFSGNNHSRYRKLFGCRYRLPNGCSRNFDCLVRKRGERFGLLKIKV